MRGCNTDETTCFRKSLEKNLLERLVNRSVFSLLDVSVQGCCNGSCKTHLKTSAVLSLNMTGTGQG